VADVVVAPNLPVPPSAAPRGGCRHDDVREDVLTTCSTGDLMPAAFLRPIHPAEVRDLYRGLRSRVGSWTLYALNAQPWGRHTPTH
jgi:hypothetical protein